MTDDDATVAELTVCLARIRTDLLAVLSDMGPASKDVTLRIIANIDERLHTSTTPQRVSALLNHQVGSFLERLAGDVPTLTPTELRLCGLLRAAVPSKDVAALMGCSIRSVEKHRERIRRKLNLQARENLVTFLTKRRR